MRTTVECRVKKRTFQECGKNALHIACMTWNVRRFEICASSCESRALRCREVGRLFRATAQTLPGVTDLDASGF